MRYLAAYWLARIGSTLVLLSKRCGSERGTWNGMVYQLLKGKSHGK